MGAKLSWLRDVGVGASLSCPVVMVRCGPYLFFEEASKLAQAAALHLVSILVLGLRLELGLHVVELGDRRRGIQLFEQAAPALEELLRDGGHACIIG